MMSNHPFHLEAWVCIWTAAILFLPWTLFDDSSLQNIASLWLKHVLDRNYISRAFQQHLSEDLTLFLPWVMTISAWGLGLGLESCHVVSSLDSLWLLIATEQSIVVFNTYVLDRNYISRAFQQNLSENQTLFLQWVMTPSAWDLGLY